MQEDLVNFPYPVFELDDDNRLLELNHRAEDLHPRPEHGKMLPFNYVSGTRITLPDGSSWMPYVTKNLVFLLPYHDDRKIQYLSHKNRVQFYILTTLSVLLTTYFNFYLFLGAKYPASQEAYRENKDLVALVIGAYAMALGVFFKDTSRSDEQKDSA